MRIFTATPLAVLKETDRDSDFFCRDMGLTCYALREKGVESQVVLLDFPGAKKHPDIIRTELGKMADPEWWRAFELEAVVLGAWADPKYTSIARAIKESGAKLIVRCDSGGPYSQRNMSFFGAIYKNYLGPRYRRRGPLFSVLYSLLRTAVGYIPSFYEKKVVDHMACADLIMNETPEGVRCLKAMLCRHGRTDVASRVKYVLHPVGKGMGYLPAVKKAQRIIAVGRWDNYQKNTPLLIRSLSRALNEYPDYEAHIFGGGEEMLRNFLDQVPQPERGRIHIRGKIPNDQLVEEYRKSRILFMPSRSEGSSVAAEEALACGCSVVGGAHIFCMRNFVSKNSGTLARRYTVKGMAEALTVEIMAWDAGMRNPGESSALWSLEAGQTSIINEIISAVSERAMPDTAPSTRFETRAEKSYV